MYSVHTTVYISIPFWLCWPFFFTFFYFFYFNSSRWRPGVEFLTKFPFSSKENSRGERRGHRQRRQYQGNQPKTRRVKQESSSQETHSKMPSRFLTLWSMLAKPSNQQTSSTKKKNKKDASTPHQVRVPPLSLYLSPRSWSPGHLFCARGACHIV